MNKKILTLMLLLGIGGTGIMLNFAYADNEYEREK